MVVWHVYAWLASRCSEGRLTCAFWPSVRTSSSSGRSTRCCCRASRSTSLSKAGPSPGASTTPGSHVTAGDPRRVDTYLKADISPSTCFIVEDNGRRSIKKVLDGDPRRRRHARSTSFIPASAAANGRADARRNSRDVTHLDLPELHPADAGHRAEPLDDPRARAAVPALLRRRRPAS